MSQVSIIDIEGNHPQIPTQFNGNIGSAIPIANELNIFATNVANGTVPAQTRASGNTVTVEIQRSAAIAATDATRIGLSAFNSAEFTVDPNGFVSLIGGGAAIDSIQVDASTAPGVNPVAPNGSGLITVTGAQVANGVVGANVIRTNSIALNAYRIEIQRSTANATTNVNLNGVSHYNSAHFSVDGNGFVSLAGAGLAVDSFAVQTGTSPVVPTAAGLVNFNGVVVAAGTNPVRTNGTGVNTMALEIQISQAIAATNATNIGLSAFDSTSFSVDANGFVQLKGAGFTWNDVSGAFSPLKNNGYFITATATGTLPASPAQGDTIKFFVDTTQKLTIDAPGTQIIRMGSLVTSAGGTFISTLQGDSCELVYRAADTCWCAIAGFTGTWTLT